MTYSHEQLKAMCPLSISECSQKHVQSVVAELIETALAQPASTKERWNIERDGDALLVCFNSHEKGEACRYARFVPEAQPASVPALDKQAAFEAWLENYPIQIVGDDYELCSDAFDAGVLAAAPSAPQPAQAEEAAAPAPEPAADPGTTIDDGARIFARVMEYGGKMRRQVVNPCITARECIALANYIAASDRAHYSQGKPQGEEPVGRIMRSAQTLALAVHFKQPKEAQDQARENFRAVVLDAMASAKSPAVGAPQPEAQPQWQLPAQRLVQWLHCMSYNDSYFGEPAGYLKQCVNELKHLLPPNEVRAAPSAQAPQPEAQPPGFALVQIAELTKWKSLANSLAVLSLKSERATTAIILKSLIQDAIDAAPSAQAEPPICGNCDEPAPGCGGLFASDGAACQFHGKQAEQGGK